MKPLVFCVPLLLALLLLGCAQLPSSQERNSPVGLWKLEKGFAFDESAQEFKEIKDEKPTAFLLFEFTPDNKLCTSWEGDPPTCRQYEQVEIQGDLITPKTQASGQQSRARWKISEGKLELVIENLYGSEWKPNAKLVLAPIASTSEARVGIPSVTESPGAPAATTPALVEIPAAPTQAPPPAPVAEAPAATPVVELPSFGTPPPLPQ